ncbi:MAG: C_GCAxxG_C_C family protein [Clostridia bacterium]|nr:C_GCAxxG_C_C family protein [Clostridia bacterium]
MKGEIAKDNFLKGLNCAQAVVLAFKDELDLPEETIKKLSIGFGGGLARQRLTCGAVSGMSLVLGAIRTDGKDKTSAYALIRSACDEFKAETGSLICAEMLSGEILKDKSAVPEERTPEYYEKRPCADLCALAAEIVEKYIKR